MWCDFVTRKKQKAAKYLHESSTKAQPQFNHLQFSKTNTTKQKKKLITDLAAIQMFEKMHLQPNYNLIISGYRYLYNPIYLSVKYQNNTVFLAFIRIPLCYKTY